MEEEEHHQQVKGGDSPLLLSTGDATPGVLGSDLSCPVVRERRGHTGVRPAKDH